MIIAGMALPCDVNHVTLISHHVTHCCAGGLHDPQDGCNLGTLIKVNIVLPYYRTIWETVVQEVKVAKAVIF